MKKLIFALPAVLVLCACDKKPQQQFDLMCGDYRVSANLYADRIDLDIVRKKLTTDYWEYPYEWAAHQMPQVDDSIKISLPKIATDSELNEFNLAFMMDDDKANEHIFDDGQKQMAFAIKYNRYNDSASMWLGTYITGYDDSDRHPYDRINGHIINGWRNCTPILPFTYPVVDPKGKANVTPQQAKELKKCLREIANYNICSSMDENGDSFYWAYCNRDDKTQRIKISDTAMEQILNKSQKDIEESGRRYSSIRMYDTDGVIRTWQTDACDVAKRLTEYMNQQNVGNK